MNILKQIATELNLQKRNRHDYKATAEEMLLIEKRLQENEWHTDYSVSFGIDGDYNNTGSSTVHKTVLKKQKITDGVKWDDHCYVFSDNRGRLTCFQCGNTDIKIRSNKS